MNDPEAADGEKNGESGNQGKEEGEKAPDFKTQKTEIHASLQQRLKQGDTW